MTARHIPKDWPHRDASLFVEAGGLNWHVQRLGQGPTLFLIHGTAASTHSFRDLATALCNDFEIVMADLPGHGFTSAMQAPTLPRVASALSALIRRMGLNPECVAGHSAGAAIALRMALDRTILANLVVGLAPALRPFGGVANGLALGLTRLAFLNPIAPRVLSFKASPQRVGRIIARTGSQLEEEGVALYAQLLQRPDHVAGALRLMAHWNLQPLIDDLPGLATPVRLIVTDGDLATPARDTRNAARLLQNGHITELQGVGHLVHEEKPQMVGDLLRQWICSDQPEVKRTRQC